MQMIFNLINQDFTRFKDDKSDSESEPREEQKAPEKDIASKLDQLANDSASDAKQSDEPGQDHIS